MGVKIVTDTSCDLPKGMEKALDIRIVPLIFLFGEAQYKDKTMSMAEFWAKAEEVWPKTAAPSTGDFECAFRDCVDAGHQVVCITVTSKLSATYNAAVIASQRFSPGQVTVIDSLSLSVAQGYLVQAAAQAACEGANLAGVLDAIEVCRQKLHIYISLDTVQYLVKGGRASKLSGILANLLKIRPMLAVQDGELVLREKLRGRNAAKERLLELALEYFPANKVSVAHVDCADEARRLAVELSARTGFPLSDIPFIEVGMALATHGGPGTLAIAVVSV